MSRSASKFQRRTGLIAIAAPVPAALALVLTMSLALLGACDRASRPAVAEVRIACISPGAAATLLDLGITPDHPSEHGVQIIGRHDYDIVLPASVPPCGDQNALDYERLIELEPTHIVIEWGVRPLPDRLQQLARAHDWAIVPLRMLTLDEMDQGLASLDSTFVGGPALRRGVGVEPYPALRGDLLSPERLGVSAAEAAGAGRVLLLGSVAPDLGAIGPGAWHHEILVLLGGQPALPESAAPWISMDAEDVLHLAPEAIIILDPRPVAAPAPAWPAHAPEWSQVERRLGVAATFAQLPAIADRRVALLTDPTVHLPGTPVVRYAEALAEVLKSWSLRHPGAR